MVDIFISYRRDDSAGWTGRLTTDLQRRFGQKTVFQDIGAIEPGEDFIAVIERSLQACSVVLVVIGREWSLAKDKAGLRRLDNPEDPVRLEVAMALARKDLLVIPVLVGGAKMPTRAELPTEITALANRNAFELSDKRWDFDFKQLESILVRKANTKARITYTKFARPRLWIIVSVLATGVIIAIEFTVTMIPKIIWRSTGRAGDVVNASQPVYEGLPKVQWEKLPLGSNFYNITNSDVKVYTQADTAAATLTTILPGGFLPVANAVEPMERAVVNGERWLRVTFDGTAGYVLESSFQKTPQ
jgi:hypothetical protein